MLKYLLFSDKIRLLIKWLDFRFEIAKRWFKLLFSRRRNLTLVYLNVSDTYLFQSSYFAISFRFEHAIWYKFSNGIKRIQDGVLLIHQYEQLTKPYVNLTVYGFLQKQHFQIPLQVRKINHLQTKTFKIEPLKINSLIYRNNKMPARLIPNFTPRNIPFHIKEDCISIKTTEIKINQKNFHLNDFI